MPKDDADDPRGDLDASLSMTSWSVPGQRRYDESDVPGAAPSWWHGEEEASQTFFRAMGIDPTKLNVQ